MYVRKCEIGLAKRVGDNTYLEVRSCSTKADLA